MIYMANVAGNQFLGDEISTALFGIIDGNLTCTDGKLTLYSQLRNEASTSLEQKVDGITSDLYNQATYDNVRFFISSKVEGVVAVVNFDELLQIIRQSFSPAYDSDIPTVGEDFQPPDPR
jgi:hypothetical protein